MDREPQIHLLLELETEVARWRRRTMFLLSLVLHGVAALILLFSPNLFRRGAEAMGIRLDPQRERETTFLYMPPDLLESLRKPPPDTPILSDKDANARPFAEAETFP